MKKHLYIDDKYIIQQHSDPFNEDVEEFAQTPVKPLEYKPQAMKVIEELATFKDFLNKYKEKADKLVKSRGLTKETMQPIIVDVYDTYEIYDRFFKKYDEKEAEEKELREKPPKNFNERMENLDKGYKAIKQDGEGIIRLVKRLQEKIKK